MRVAEPPWAARCGLASLMMAILPLLLTSGCAKLRSLLPVDDVRPVRLQRARQAAKSMDAARDQAEYRAALSRWQQGDLPGCRQSLDHLLKRSPQHRDARLLMAELCLLESQAAEAQRHLDSALASHPDDPRVLHTLGTLADARGDTTAALAHYQRAAELAPHDTAYTASYESALATARQSAEGGDPRDPGTPPDHAVGAAQVEPVPPSAELWLDEAERALADGAIDEGRECLQRAVAAAPRDPRVRISSGVSALRQGHAELSLELAIAGCAAFPDSSGMYRLLGAAHYRLGDWKASQVALQQALSLDNSDPLSYFLMGSTLARLGQAESAEWHYRQARLRDPRYAAVP